ncbi:unnamed protein product [Pylaiella littoralis]
MVMSWSQVISVLLAAPIVTPCGGALYGGSVRPYHSVGADQERGFDGDGGAITYSTAGFGSRAAEFGSAVADADGKGGAEALRRFASTRAMKTGTTIAGVIFEGGVVLGADTRATGGKTVCDRNCDKIHVLASNIACCGAGTSADAVRITEGARLALLRMAGEMQACLPSRRFPLSRAHASGVPGEASNNADMDIPFAHRDSDLDVVQRRYLRVAAAAFLLKRHLFRYQGVVSAALVLGGVDATGEHIYQIHDGGSFAEVQFTAMGSGSLAALSALERGHRENLTEQEAKELVLEAIAAGIDNDLGSGSNIDICVITAERGLEHHRGAWKDPGLAGVGSDAAPRNLTQGEDSPASSDSKTDDSDDDSDDDDNGNDNGKDSDDSHPDSEADEAPETTARRAEKRREGKARSKRRRPCPQTATGIVTESGQQQRVQLPGTSSAAIEVGGQGGSRAWVGNVRRRRKGKSVLRVDHQEDGGGTLRSFRCSALDDKVEVL